MGRARMSSPQLRRRTSDQVRDSANVALRTARRWRRGRAVDPGPKDPGWLSDLEDADDAFTEILEGLSDAQVTIPKPESRARKTRRLGRPLAINNLFEFTRGRGSRRPRRSADLGMPVP